MNIDWDWFEEYYKKIFTILLGILIVVKIDIWVNGKSTFLDIINSLIFEIISDFIIIVLILLFVLLYQQYEE